MTTNTTTQNTREIADALAENYLGFGSTPEMALVALTDDLLNNRLHGDEYYASQLEMLNAIGRLLKQIMDSALAA